MSEKMLAGARKCRLDIFPLSKVNFFSSLFMMNRMLFLTTIDLFLTTHVLLTICYEFSGHPRQNSKGSDTAFEMMKILMPERQPATHSRNRSQRGKRTHKKATFPQNCNTAAPPLTFKQYTSVRYSLDDR